MSEVRTYQHFKDFFDEINRANKLEFYRYSFVLLFGFLEDRINVIFEDQYKKEKGRPSGYDREPIGWKMRMLPKLGLNYPPSILKTLNMITKRRNEITHQSIFNLHVITKQDISFLTRFCRSIDKIRTNQKKKLGKQTRKTLTLNFPSGIPDLSSFRKVDNPQSYPLSHK